MCIYSELTAQQQATVTAIFADMPRSDISWQSVLDLFKGLINIDGLNGSVDVSAGIIRVVIKFKGESIVGILPCPDEMGCVGSYMIEDLRDILSGVGVEPQ
jgi:hypothetical protein